jgi:hypothetical protein
MGLRLRTHSPMLPAGSAPQPRQQRRHIDGERHRRRAQNHHHHRRIDHRAVEARAPVCGWASGLVVYSLD